MAITNKEAKQLLYEERPVFFRNIKYRKISALIYRKSEGTFKASAELLDMNQSCVVICPLEWIDASEDERIEIFGQEEVESILGDCQEEMARLTTLVGQGKPTNSQDSLHKLLQKLVKLDNELIKQVNAAEEIKEETAAETHEEKEDMENLSSLGGLDEEEGKENIPQVREEKQWIAR